MKACGISRIFFLYCVRRLLLRGNNVWFGELLSHLGPLISWEQSNPISFPLLTRTQVEELITNCASEGDSQLDLHHLDGRHIFILIDPFISLIRSRNLDQYQCLV